MAEAGERRYLDDFQVGQRFTSSTYTMTEAEIVAFAREFDPQPFHLSHDEGRSSLLGGLAASGWHTAAVTMRLWVEGEMQAAGGIVGAGGEITWPAPTRPETCFGSRPRSSRFARRAHTPIAGSSRSSPRRRITTASRAGIQGHARRPAALTVRGVHRRPTTEAAIVSPPPSVITGVDFLTETTRDFAAAREFSGTALGPQRRCRRRVSDPAVNGARLVRDHGRP